MAGPESSPADHVPPPAPVLGYATPIPPRTGTENLRATAFFALVQFGGFLALSFDGPRPSFSPESLLKLFLVIGFASLGFSSAWPLLRPPVQARRWQFVISTVAAAATIGVCMEGSQVGRRLLPGFFGSGSFWFFFVPYCLAMMAASFITNSILLLACKGILAGRRSERR